MYINSIDNYIQIYIIRILIVSPCSNKAFLIKLFDTIERFCNNHLTIFIIPTDFIIISYLIHSSTLNHFYL